MVPSKKHLRKGLELGFISWDWKRK